MKYHHFIFLLPLLLVACTQPAQVDFEAEQAKILKLHQLQRTYHFQKDSIAFANQLSDSFISVNRGIISRPKRAATVSRYHGYFSAVEFQAWNDLAEPIIRFSEDGKMAYTIVDKLVRVTYEGTDGEQIEDETHFAWTAIYRKYEDEWKIDCVTSTEIPK